MAGLLTAFLLSRDPHTQYSEKIFESGKSVSLDIASISIPDGPQTPTDRIDIPMREFAGEYYKNLKAMYDFIAIRYHLQTFFFEFAKVLSKGAGASGGIDSSYFIHASNHHQMPPPRPSARSTAAFLVDVFYLPACYTWFSFCCFFLPPRMTSAGVCDTVDEYLKRSRLSEHFITYFLLQHYPVSNGIKAVQDKPVRGIPYELSATGSAVKSQSNGVKISWRYTDGTKSGVSREAIFDRVILAVSPDIVGRLFEPLKDAMAQIPTSLVESVIYNDRTTISTVNAKKGHLKSSAQFIYLRTSIEDTHRTESIQVQQSGAIVTTCHFSPIKPTLIIRSSRFTRVLQTPESRQLVNAIFKETHDYPKLTNEKRKSKWRNGDGNGCVISAMRVADAFGVGVPWRNHDSHVCK
ncbi:hypothetical protein K505DRAFT_345276 [Melanomma pulvis-pyrius CBS 109.77]|uniref:Amine oxidase domain-containing protein n=1 Tax=Melanomma pulvis-pyrius CBS 109.77 TaxID=1314802 RepID=A0A6A6XX53_9PLEO|nr:hypothetical protein K505DRAFT_345276 [Melanomma pulvis-pyrius CBS 109.77]